MPRYVLKPGLSVAYLPEIGQVLPDAVLSGEKWQRFVPGFLVVLPEPKPDCSESPPVPSPVTTTESASKSTDLPVTADVETSVPVNVSVATEVTSDAVPEVTGSTEVPVTKFPKRPYKRKQVPDEPQSAS
jgi:hypothetical protein